MSFQALACPQCGGPLPRQAAWRMVVCPHCGSTVTRSAEVVARAPYRAALARSLAAAGGTDDAAAGPVVIAGGARYRRLRQLDDGRGVEVFLVERLGVGRTRAVLKLARDSHGDGGDGDRSAATRLAAEARNLAALQAIDAPGSPYFSQRLPQPIFSGPAETADGERSSVLLLRHAAGYDASLASVMAAAPAGVDARHAVWMWRRVLEVLTFVHAAGWTHGDLTPAHLLVHPADHGIRIVGWGRAQHATGAALERGRQRDLAQSAWSMRAVLSGPGPVGGDDAARPGLGQNTPPALATLLRSASEDAAWLQRHAAAAVEQSLVGAAASAWGPPRFVPFDPFGHSAGSESR